MVPNALQAGPRVAVLAVLISAPFVIAGCATQAPPVSVKEAPQTAQAQSVAQQVTIASPPARPTLKRKIALELASGHDMP